MSCSFRRFCQVQGVDTMSVLRWATVSEADPALTQQWFNARFRCVVVTCRRKKWHI